MVSWQVLVEEYLQRQGAIGVLLNIDPTEGSLFTDLKDEVPVSQTTLSNRLEDGRKYQLFSVGTNPEDHGNAQRYQLTELGFVFRRALESIRMDEWYQQYVDALEKLDRGEEIIEDWGHSLGEPPLEEASFEGITYPGAGIVRYGLDEEPIDPREAVEEDDFVELTEDIKVWKKEVRFFSNTYDY